MVGAKVYTIQIGNGDEVDVQDGARSLRPAALRARALPGEPRAPEEARRRHGRRSYVATDAQALTASMHAVLDQLEKTRFEASTASFEDLFPFLLFPGVLLVALDALLRAWVLRRFP